MMTAIRRSVLLDSLLLITTWCTIISRPSSLLFTVEAFSTAPAKTIAAAKKIPSRPSTASTTSSFQLRAEKMQEEMQSPKEKLLSEEVQAAKQDALFNVGWAMPDEGDLTSDDPFVQAIDAGIQRDFGVELDELLNPAKVVNLERDLFELRKELADLTGVNLDGNDADGNDSPIDLSALTTRICDGGGGGEEAEKIRSSIAKKESSLNTERRAVFRGWLKTVFLGQAVLSFFLSFVMATNPSVLFGGFDWYGKYNMDVSISVLGYWWWWLFVVPSLRSRRPKGSEKQALDLAFLGTPLISLVAPVVTKDTGAIWAANFAVVVGCYAYAFLLDTDGDNDDSGKSQPDWLKFIYKSLDFGSGRERGARN